MPSPTCRMTRQPHLLLRYEDSNRLLPIVWRQVDGRTADGATAGPRPKPTRHPAQAVPEKDGHTWSAMYCGLWLLPASMLFHVRLEGHNQHQVAWLRQGRSRQL